MTVNVSDLSRYEFCPRMIYLTQVLGVKAKPTLQQLSGLVGHYVRKELSFRQARIIGRVKSEKEIDSVLGEELESIIKDVPFIYREKWTSDCDSVLPEIKGEVSNELALLSERLRFLVGELGLQESLRTLTPWKVEYDLKSDALGLSGRVDKLMREGEKLVPIELKTGKAGESVWEGDRIQLCGYCMLLEEKFKEKVMGGFVEYTRVQEKRPVLASEKLRRRVIHNRNSILDLLAGKVPEICPHGSGRKCESCSIRDECYKT